VTCDACFARYLHSLHQTDLAKSLKQDIDVLSPKKLQHAQIEQQLLKKEQDIA
jgi:hypothetical protein